MERKGADCTRQVLPEEKIALVSRPKKTWQNTVCRYASAKC